MIMTAYQPVLSQGPNTVWMQQWVLLRESGLKNPDPIEIFYINLETLLMEWKNLGYEIILMMDSNEAIGYHSNHRAIFATIQIEKILMTTMSTVDSITARKLHQATPRERCLL
jgi:hypothetical protein